MKITNVRPCTGPTSDKGFLNLGRFTLQVTPEIALFDLTIVRAPHGKLMLYGPQTTYGAPSMSFAPQVRSQIISHAMKILEKEDQNAQRAA